MLLADNIYIVLGVPCAGKTTVANELRKNHRMYYFGGDSKRFDYFQQAEKSMHPAMCRDMSDFFDLSCRELIKWEQDVITEQTPMIISDLDLLSRQHEKVIFEGILDLNIIAPFIAKNRILYLSVSREIRERDFYNRKEHIKMLENIQNNNDITEAEKDRRIHLRRTVAINFCPDDATEYGITQFVRTDDTKLSDFISSIERHFELDAAPAL